MFRGNLYLKVPRMRCRGSRLFGIRASRVCAVLFLIICGRCNVVLAQTFEVAAPAVPQIVQPLDEGRRLQLKGSTHPLARSEFDQGVPPSSLPIDRVFLVLRRSPEREAALEKLTQEQLDPTSSNFHRWLTPEEFGSNYGPADEDIQKVTSWLESRGFAVNNVSKGRMFIEFSGTAGQISQAFHTGIHRYIIRGEEHIANSNDPEIPAALGPVVAGIESLNDFHSTPLHHAGGLMRRSNDTGEWSPVDDASPQFLATVSGQNYELITPYDFATIYNVLPLWNATSPIDGTGQTIAIAGRSDISLSDVANFRSSFGLPPNVPTIIVNGPAPGVPTASDKLENTLDVEWAGSVAKGATIVYVNSKNTSSTGGDFLSDEYIVDNDVAPVMSSSYGTCELNAGTAGNLAINALWQQAAAEGIAVFIPTGDAGSAACDNPDQAAPSYATQGLQVNALASTPYDVAVGGTDFNYVGARATYWNGTNDPTTGASAKGYVPEIPWNSTCTNPVVDTLLGLGNAETTCNSLAMGTRNLALVNIVGGSGGVSGCTTPSGSTPASCSGGYPKPSWQTGVGVPTGGMRNLPDVSLFAANGVLGSAYLVCDSAQSPDGTCSFNNSADVLALSVGGTSVSSPAMASVMALVNQKMGSPQGNPNSVFYRLAALDILSNCNAGTVGNGSNCIFYDITTGTNAMACSTGTRNCTTATSGDTSGVLTGYSATVGYDLATGLGSTNVANLVNNWNSILMIQPAATTLSYNGATTFTDAAAANPSAILTQTNGGSAVVGASVLFTLGSGGAAQTCTGITNASGGATCQIASVNQTAGSSTISASFAGNPSFLASSVGPVTVTILPAAAATTLTYNGPTTFTFGSAANLSALLTRTTGGSAVAGASVLFTLGNGGTAQTCSGTTDATGAASCSIASVNQTTSPIAVAASFSGNSSNLASSAGPVAVTVSSFNLSNATGSQTIVAGQSATFTIATTAVGGSSLSVTFTATGMPSETTVTFNPASVMSGANTTMTVTTTVRPAASQVPSQPREDNLPQPPATTPSAPLVAWLSALALAALMMGLAFAPLKREPQTRFVPVAALILLTAAAGYVVGCGGGASQPPLPGTPAGTYTILVTGSSSSTNVHSTNVTLTVQ